MRVIIVVGNIRKEIITFISRVAMMNGQLLVEEIIIVVIITFDGTEFTPLASGIFWVGFGERSTVSNVPELPKLSHEVQQESFFDRGCCNNWGVRHDSTLGMQDTGLDVNRAYSIVFSIE
jgi:hypothetical protein